MCDVKKYDPYGNLLNAGDPEALGVFVLASDYAALEAENARLRAGQEPVDTVPKWRHDALIQHAKHQDKVIAKLNDEKNTAWLYEQKEVWFWQGDGEDYPESLCCPVVIKADDLRALIAATPQPSAVPDADIACDRSYRNGLIAGFGFGINGDEAGYQRSLNCYQQGIHEALAAAPATPAAQRAVPEGWECSLNKALVLETERAIKQRDKFLETGISTAGHGGSHDTCFAAIVSQHIAMLAAVPANPAERQEQGEFGDAYQGAREDLAIWKRRALEAEEKLRKAEQSTPAAIEVIGYASPGQVEILRKLPRTGGMKVRGCKDGRYTEPVVLLSAARSALLTAVIRCEQAGAFKMCMECGYQDGHDPICKFHYSNRAAQEQGEVQRLRMQLAACGVVALANTPESASEARQMHPDYMSASCSDVADAVDRELTLRQQLAERDAQIASMRAEVTPFIETHWMPVARQRDKLADLLVEVKSDLSAAMNWGDLDRIAVRIDAALAEVEG